MRLAILGGLFVATLAACWGPAKPGSTSSAGGQGGSGGDTCSSCGDVALHGEPSAGLCTTSANLFEAVRTCGCDSGPCAASCYESLCSGLAANAACQTCMQSKCASSYALCAKDASR